MNVVIVDLGAGNLHSLAKAFSRELPGATVSVSSDVEGAVAAADLLALPGVGAFGHAAARLAPVRDLLATEIGAGRPTIGICLGMQLLFDTSEEGEGKGLGVLPGTVERMKAARLPHMGWSAIRPSAADAPMTAALPAAAYFAHSFACRTAVAAQVLATADVDGETIPAVVGSGAVFGCQFHPEKSSAAGVRFLGWLAREALRRGGGRS